MSICVKRVDYQNERDCQDLTKLLAEYATLETGERPDLTGLPEQLAEFPTSFSVLAFADELQSDAIGLINCFFGFSTFQRRKLVNIHDVVVTETQRGNGVAGLMLAEVERIAVENGCCRLTLEVYADNDSARRAYERFGFIRDPEHPDVDAVFLRKPLGET